MTTEPTRPIVANRKIGTGTGSGVTFQTAASIADEERLKEEEHLKADALRKATETTAGD